MSNRYSYLNLMLSVISLIEVVDYSCKPIALFMIISLAMLHKKSNFNFSLYLYSIFYFISVWRGLRNPKTMIKYKDILHNKCKTELKGRMI